MATWTAPTILPTGSPLPSTAYNNVANNTTFLWQKPYISVFDSVGTGVGSGGDTIIQMGGTTFSNYGWTVLDGNTLQVPLAGVYHFDFRVSMGTALAGGMYSLLFLNGNAIMFGTWEPLFASNAIGGSSSAGLTQSVGGGLLPCNQGDQVFLACYQNSGGDVNCQPGSAQTALEVFLVGSL